MKLIFNSLKFKLIVISAVFFLCLNYALFYILFLPSYKKQLDEALVNKLKLTGSHYVSSVLNLFELKDDLGTLKIMESITNDKEFLYARLLDPTGKLLAHNKIQEWGKVLSGEFTGKIINSQKELLLTRKAPDGYDYSIPLFKNEEKIAVFSIGISNEILEDKMLILKGKIFNIFWLVFLLQVVLFYLINNFLFFQPVAKLLKIVNSFFLGKKEKGIEYKGCLELNKFVALIEQFAGAETKRFNELLTKTETLERKYDSFVKEIYKFIEDPFFVLDAEGKFVYINSSGKKKFIKPRENIIPVQPGLPSSGPARKNEEISKHFLEVIENQELLNLIKKSLNSQNLIIENNFEGGRLKLLTLNVGTLVLFGENS